MYYKQNLHVIQFLISDIANSTVRFDDKGDGLARYTIYNYQKDGDSNNSDYKVIFFIIFGKTNHITNSLAYFIFDEISCFLYFIIS